MRISELTVKIVQMFSTHLATGRTRKTVENILQTLLSILQTARKFGSAVPAVLSVVQRQLRHRDARTTLQKYGHVVGDAQRRAVDTLAKKIERHVAIELEPSAEMEPSSG